MNSNNSEENCKRYKGFPVPVLKGSDGRASTSFTITVVSFGLVALHYVAWVVGGIFDVEIPAFSATEATLFLSSAYGLYFARKWATDKSNASKSNLDENT